MVVEGSEIGGRTVEGPDATRGESAGVGPLTGLDPRRRWLAQGDTLVTSRVSGDTAVIRVAGELDAVSAPRLWRSAQVAFQRGRRVVVIDLTGTVFLDSFGVAALLMVWQRAQRRGCPLAVVAGDGDPVRRVLGLAGADSVLPLFGSVAAALAGMDTALAR